MKRNKTLNKQPRQSGVKWQLMNDGEIWKPKPGESIEGVLLTQQVGWDAKNAMEFPSVTISDGIHTWSIRTDRAKLTPLNRIAKQTLVKVVYKGKRKVNNLQPMLDFEVYLPHDAKVAEDWTQGRFARKPRGTQGHGARKQRRK